MLYLSNSYQLRDTRKVDKMPFIPAPNVLKASLIGHRSGTNQMWVNNLHFKYSGAPGTTEREDLLTALQTFWTSHYAPVLSAQCYIDQIVVTDLSSVSAPTSTYVYTPIDHGGLSNNVKPANVTLCITQRTALRGRNYRGRTYIPGVVDEQTTNHDFMATGSLGDILSAFAWLLNAAHTAAGIWSVVSYFFANSPRGTAVSTPITAVTADSTLDSMRRRLPGRGA